MKLLICVLLSAQSNALLSSSSLTFSALRTGAKFSEVHSSATSNNRNGQEPLFPEKLNIIYDSKCSVCQWEVDYLQKRITDLMGGRDKSNNLIRFTDLESQAGYNEFDPANGGVTYTMGMKSFHAVKPNGEILQGVPVFVEAYKIVDQGWVWNWSEKLPLAGKLASLGYDAFAKVRTQLTRGSSVEKLIEVHYGKRREFVTKKDGSGSSSGDEVCEPCQSKIMEETS